MARLFWLVFNWPTWFGDGQSLVAFTATGSNIETGIRLPANGVRTKLPGESGLARVVNGSKMVRTEPSALRVLEKSPPSCAAVGTVNCEKLPDLTILFSNRAKKKVISFFIGPPVL